MDLASDSGTPGQALIVAERLTTACGRVHCSCESGGLEEFFAFAAQENHINVPDVQPLVTNYLQSVATASEDKDVRIPPFVMETSERILSRPAAYVENFQLFRRTHIPLAMTAT